MIQANLCTGTWGTFSSSHGSIFGRPFIYRYLW